MSSGDDKLRDASAGMLELMAKTEEHRVRHSHSSLSTYQGCPLRYFYSQVEGLEPLQPTLAHDLLYGSAVHEALATFYQTGSMEQGKEVFATTYPRATFPNPLPKFSLGKSYDNALAALDAYETHWSENDRHWEVVEVELLDDVDDIRNQAETSRVLKLDLVVFDHRDQRFYGVDHKITGKYLDNTYWSYFEPHSQVRQYTNHLIKKYGNCGGFLINAITCKYRSKAVTPRSGPNKGVKLEAGYWHDFNRNVYLPNQEALEMEEVSVGYWIARIEADKQSGQWGYNTGECHRGGGSCEYLPLCERGVSWPGDSEQILFSYRQVCRQIMLDDKGRRCQLDRGHEGGCDSTPREITPDPASQDYEFTVDEDPVEVGEDGWIEGGK